MDRKIRESKKFDEWHPFKKKLDEKDNPPTFSEREIWWCSVGVNIGYEIFGKSTIFTRPVLIIRKLSSFTFLGAPMTTSKKGGYYRIPYNTGDKDGYVLLDQIRVFDARRLVNDRYIQKMHPNEFKKIKQAMIPALIFDVFRLLRGGMCQMAI